MCKVKESNIHLKNSQLLQSILEKLNLQKRCCVICDRILIGRSDKVFCDIKCKNKYHHIVRTSLKHYNNQTTSALFKNHQILAGLMSENQNQFVIDQLALEIQGFKFEYITGYEQIKGVNYFSVFDYNFQKLNQKRILISVAKERKPLSPFIFKRWSKVYQETK